MRFLIVLLVLIDWVAGVPRFIPSLAGKREKPRIQRFPESIERGMFWDTIPQEQRKPLRGE